MGSAWLRAWPVAGFAVVLLLGTVVGVSGQSGIPAPVPIEDRPFAGPYFVTQQYRDLLGREPDDAGLAFWSGRVGVVVSAPQMVEEFVESAEFAGSRAPVARLYLASFGRLPDDGGWKFWTARLQAGESLGSIARGFVASPEGVARFGGADNATVVGAVYQNVLGRTPDPAGLSFWVNQMEAGLTTAGLVLAFSEAAEFVEASDPVINAALLYSGLLGRTPDPEGLDYWADRLAAGDSYAEVVDGFLRSQEYIDRLSGLWCAFTEVTPWEHYDGPEPPERDAGWDEVNVTLRSIGEVLYDEEVGAEVDEILGIRRDSHPDDRLVVGIGGDVMRNCLTVLSAAAFPQRVVFVAKPYTRSELRAVQSTAWRYIEDNDIYAYGVGASFGLQIELSGTAESFVDEIIDRWGPFIEELRLGAFPYPMPQPLWPGWCEAWEPNVVDPATVGVELDLTLSSISAAAGEVLSYELVMSNVGSERLYLEVAQDNYALGLGAESGQPSVSRALGAFDAVGYSFDLAPGESAIMPGVVGTEACDPVNGHRLPAGTYSVRGHLNAWRFDGSGESYSEEPDYLLRVPAQVVTITR